MTELPINRVELTPEATRDGYDRWAATYDDHDNPLVAATAWALALHPPPVAGRDVVELGCGTGRLAPVVLAAGARAYTGVDSSAGMLARARAAVVEPRATWIEADLAAVPRPAASFDVALVVLVLEHLATLAPVMAELARLLRPGGVARVLELHPARIERGTRAHFRAGADELWFHSTAHPPDALRAALAAAGLELVAWREHVADGRLLAQVPRLAKHRGLPVVLDLEVARR